jgi:hypothetical protein
VTSLVLACIEVTQGVCIAAFQGLEVVKRTITKRERAKDAAHKLSDAVHRDMESLPTTPSSKV